MTESAERMSDGAVSAPTAERRVVSFTQPIASLGVLGMLVTAAFTVLDVVLRAFDASPITALNEFVSLVMAVSIVTCLPAGLARRVGLDVDLGARLIGKRGTVALRITGHFLLLIFMALLAWRLGAAAVAEGARGQKTIILGLPTAPFLWTITGLLALCVPVQAFVTGGEIRSTVRGASGRHAALIGGLLICALAAIAFVLVPKSAISPFLPTGAAGLALAFFGLLWVLILLMVPIGPALGLTGLLGAAALLGLDPALSVLGTEAQSFLTNESLATLPLFLLMGAFAGVAGLSSDIFQLAQALIGHRRGGLALATIGGCAGFGALTGSSLATAVVIGKVALPE
ncbi:MAG: TRAP transporter large permease subunit, partial [Rhodospirillaceae bacterium]|nr:TRAP transporter large permease subunit [Rhodospirillaceae bacterium]